MDQDYLLATRTLHALDTALATSQALEGGTPPGQVWRRSARADQLPPDGSWFVWLMLAGRGFGKTRSGAEWVTEMAQRHPGYTIGVVGPTWRDTADVPMAEIIRCLPADSYRYNVSDLHIYLDNGAEIVGFSADKPSRLRGRNLAFAWCDELAAFERPDQLWTEALVPAVRIGEAPRIVVTTTPRPIRLLRALLERSDGSVVVTRGSTWDNADNLSDYALSELKSRYENTRVGRQELYGELLIDVEGALWTQEMIDAAYWPVPTGRTIRTVTAVDPSGSATGDATGIVTATLDSWNVVHIVADDTTKGSPEHRYASVCRAALRNNSGVILYEAAYGGDNIAHGIRAAWPLVAGTTPLPLLVASPTKHSKADRAHPVAALYEQTMHGTPKVVHDAPLHLLADEMTTWEPGAAWSPNRLDALVHVVRFLHSGASGVAYISTFDGLAEFPTLPIGVGA